MTQKTGCKLCKINSVARVCMMASHAHCMLLFVVKLPGNSREIQNNRDLKILWTRPRRTATGSEMFNSWN